ncbi:MAG: hypothetical protein K2M07_06160 [Muribaculaceae bacterium]|nr:hypothetical protein [Muribaculaceae bacterium]
MNEPADNNQPSSEWFAIRTKQDFRAAQLLAPFCEDLFFPLESVQREGGKPRDRAVIPHVLFLKTTRSNILDMETRGRKSPEQNVPFWIYRYPKENRIRPIPESSIELLRLLTATDRTRCEIFRKDDFRVDQRVRVIGGEFEGYEGYVQRVRKNRHVVVKIEGICMVMLPFIHPDLLQTLE